MRQEDKIHSNYQGRTVRKGRRTKAFRTEVSVRRKEWKCLRGINKEIIARLPLLFYVVIMRRSRGGTVRGYVTETEYQETENKKNTTSDLLRRDIKQKYEKENKD